MEMSVDEEIKNFLIYLGWYKYDGEVWAKGENPHMIMTQWQSAFSLEINSLVSNVAICPDCGYNIDLKEFVNLNKD